MTIMYFFHQIISLVFQLILVQTYSLTVGKHDNTFYLNELLANTFFFKEEFSKPLLKKPIFGQMYFLY